MHERTPRAGSKPAPKLADEAPAKRLRGVLLVENDPDLQWRLARTLTVGGNRVVGTSSSDGALALMAQWPVDVVLVAEDLPGMDGVELAKHIRRDHPEVPIVLMAEEGPDVELAARMAGATAWLVKPFRVEELERILAQLRGPSLERAPRHLDLSASSAPSAE
jgi:DNA-binding response OmpR family regulator